MNFSIRRQEKEHDDKNQDGVSRAPETFRYRTGHMHDSIFVQKRRGKVNDDEEHSPNPHLSDLLVPSHSAHIVEHGKNHVNEESTHMKQSGEKENKNFVDVIDPNTQEEEGGNVAVVDLDTQEELGENLKETVIHVVDPDTQEEDSEEEKESIIELVDTKTQDEDHANEKERIVVLVDETQEDTKFQRRPTLSRPARSSLYRPVEKQKVRKAKPEHSDNLDASIGSATTEATTKSDLCKSVTFHEITVREYDMTVGDHPNCSYGPPVSLGWDYLEYEPLAVDEYEYHHARRRPLRMMVLSHYRRLEILQQKGGHSEKEVKAATKEVKRVQRNRFITRKLIPLRTLDEKFEGLRRKKKKNMSSQ